MIHSQAKYIRITDMPEDRELVTLQRRFEDHLVDYRSHLIEDELRHRRHEEIHEKNMEAIGELVKATKGVIDSYQFSTRLRKFVSGIPRFIVGLSIVGAAIVWIFTKFPSLLH